MNDDWATIRARRVLEKLSDGAAMSERVEEIRRQAEDIINEWLDRDYAVAARPVPTKRERERLADRITAALAQAEAENERLRERHEDTLTTLQETAKAAIRAEDRTRALEAALHEYLDSHDFSLEASTMHKGAKCPCRDCQRARAALTAPTPPQEEPR